MAREVAREVARSMVARRRVGALMPDAVALVGTIMVVLMGRAYPQCAQRATQSLFCCTHTARQNASHPSPSPPVMSTAAVARTGDAFGATSGGVEVVGGVRDDVGSALPGASTRPRSERKASIAADTSRAVARASGAVAVAIATVVNNTV